ncbi:sialoadhesin-like [Pygocentrus nattereri]|uniref:sialoadhesin-like n=1 Tax=Pygocentrus nattereri TaxID=42514 RepID=UPI001890E3A4|nr:sialoadhesin-like [Pygocentrus nattereri]
MQHLKVTVSNTDGGVKKLTCSSTCTLPNNPTYIWYRNGQPVSDRNRHELELRDRTVDAGSYSCAVKGYEELGSPAVCVFDKGLQVKVEGPAVTASEGQTVTLTCSSTCTLPNNPTYIWYRNGQPVSECESASCSVPVVSEAVSYSCAVKGSDLHSAPVAGEIPPPQLWEQFAVWGTVPVSSALVLCLIIAVLCIRRKRGAERGADVQAPKCGDDTYSALNPNSMSSDYDTLTHVRDSPSDTYSALNPQTMSSDYDTLTPVRDSPSDTYSALNPETRTSDYDALTVVRPHPAMRRAPENEN